MVKIFVKKKNYFNCNDLIIKSMYKRRKIVSKAISRICDTPVIMKVVK